MKLKCLILCGFTLLGLQSTGIILAYHAEVETFILPQWQKYSYAELISFLYRAEHRILVAMYLITDDDIIAKLIDLKKRGFDIQIIFDESTTQLRPNIINEFRTHNIIPIVFPILPPGHNNFRTNGLMHNKFVVIDNAAVWTGSANFTSTVLNPDGARFNYENIAIINSPIAAQKYGDAFSSIERDIIKIYFQILLTNDARDLPNWVIPLCQELYQKNEQFKASLHELLSQLSDAAQQKLFSYFPASQAYVQESQIITSSLPEEQSQLTPEAEYTEEEWSQMEAMQEQPRPENNPAQQVQSSQTDNPMSQKQQDSYMAEVRP